LWLLSYGAIFIVVISNAIYHISQKSTPSTINPIVSLIVTYLTACIFCIILLPFFPSTVGAFSSLKKINWASFALGISIVGLELGFLLAYRAGWDISLAQFVVTIFVTLLLVPVGFLFFHERLAPVNIAGMVLCFIGFILISHK